MSGRLSPWLESWYDMPWGVSDWNFVQESRDLSEEIILVRGRCDLVQCGRNVKRARTILSEWWEGSGEFHGANGWFNRSDRCFRRIAVSGGWRI